MGIKQWFASPDQSAWPGNWPRYIGAIVIATLLSVSAAQTDHPVTAALAFVIAILVNGALGGLAPGLWTAAITSFIYNFFIRFPVYSFGFSTIDDYVPLIAFNITAVVSGVLSGRLKDRAFIAEKAQGELNRLLGFSNRLQSAVDLNAVAEALCDMVPHEVLHLSLMPYLRENYSIRRAEAWREAFVRRCNADAEMAPHDRRTSKKGREIDIPAYAGLLWMAIERCDLLEQHAEAEAVRRSEEFKTALLSSLSHDLRTPISAISASATGLLRFGSALEGDVQAEMLETINDQCRRLDHFTSKLLSLGQLQGGISARQMETVDLIDTLGSVILAVRRVDPKRVIRKEIGDDLYLVTANAVMLEQALFNVLENALSYSPAESEVLVRVHRAGGMVCVHVVDKGLGVDAFDLNRIFERFYRADRTAAARPGQGLGLSITKGFIESFGGTVAAMSPSTHGMGTEIIISMPEAVSEQRKLAHA